jgi:hypothetical protein
MAFVRVNLEGVCKKNLIYYEKGNALFKVTDQRDPNTYNKGTIAENVRMGRAGMGPPEVDPALAQIGLLEEIRALPEGTETILRTGGAPLSLGQARRLMLARAVAARPGCCSSTRRSRTFTPPTSRRSARSSPRMRPGPSSWWVRTRRCCTSWSSPATSPSAFRACVEGDDPRDLGRAPRLLAHAGGPGDLEPVPDPAYLDVEQQQIELLVLAGGLPVRLPAGLDLLGS